MQIPGTAQYFQGREQLIEDVLAVLQPGRVVSLVGIGGIGKTAVTAEVVKRLLPAEGLPERFPDGIIFHSFYGQPNTDIVLEHILNSLHIERQGPLDDNVRAALGGKKLLLILDGSEEADDLARVVTLAPICAVLISSRKREDIFDEGFFVKRLEQENSEVVLALWAGERIDDPQAAREICDRVGNLPLAVRLAGKYLATSGLLASEYLNWLRGTVLEALDFGDRRLDSVPVLLARSVAQVGKGAHQALAVAGSLALAPFKVKTVAAALDKPRIAAQNDLGELVNFGLLERPDASYLVTHPLVHTFARTEMNLDQEQLLSLVAYYESLTRTESSRGAAGFAQIDSERTHIMQLIRICEKRELWAAVDQLVWAVKDYLDRQGHGAERSAALQAGVRAAQATGDRHNEGNHLGNLGLAYVDLGEVSRAIGYYEQALAISKEINDRRGEGADLGNLGLAYRNLGEVARAICYYEKALVIAREIGDRQKEGEWLGGLGLVNADLGQMQQAIDYYQLALAIAREIGDRRSEGAELGNLGNAYRNLGEVTRAIKYHELALAIAREIGDRRSEGAELGNLGNAYYSLGEAARAIEYYEHALDIARETGDRRGEGADLGNLGLAYAALDKVNKAIDYYQQALAIAKEIGDRRNEGIHMGNLGNAYADLGEVARAIEYYEHALTISEEIGDRRGEGNRLANLGFAYRDLGQVERTREYWQKALAIYQEIQSPWAENAQQWLDDLDKE